MEESLVHTYISEVKSGNTASFTPLVEGYKDLVYSICIKITSNAELAEEVAQDTFVKAYQGLNKFKGKSKFSTWLYQIAYFTAINAIRKKGLERNDLSDAKSIAGNDNCLDHLASEEKKQLISQALSHLKAEERGLIILYYLDEMSIEEVSKISRLSISNVKVKIHRARKKLYSILGLILKEELNSIRYE